MSELRPVRFELGGGEFVAGDDLPGAEPAYLYVHGLGSTRGGAKSESLLAHARRRGQRFVRIDLRGHGQSSGRLGQVTISDLARDVRHVLDELDDTAVVGSSLGALVAAMAIAQRADGVAGLALLAPAIGLVTTLATRLDPLGRMWTNEGLGFRIEPQVLADAATIDERALPGRLHVPTLLVHGTLDEVIPARASEVFFAALAAPHKELWLVPGGSHRLETAAAAVWPRFDALLARR